MGILAVLLTVIGLVGIIILLNKLFNKVPTETDGRTNKDDREEKSRHNLPKLEKDD